MAPDISVLTVLRPMLVVGKTWALAWMRIVAKARALPRRRENRLPHRGKQRAAKDSAYEVA